MKLKDLIEQYGEQEVLCWAEGVDGSLAWVNIKIERPKPKTIWDLEQGDDYYHFDEGDISITTWYDWECDRERLNIGNIFLTKEDAEKDIERRKVETLLLKHGGRRWLEHGHMNYFIEYDRKSNKLDGVCTGRFLWQGLIYFDTREQVENAIKEIGEDRIKQALFEVR